jgi:hypothetical protein
MRVQDERNGYAKFDPIGEDAGSENHDVPGAGSTQVQMHRVVEADNRHYGRAYPDVMTWNEAEKRYEEGIDKSREAAGCEPS